MASGLARTVRHLTPGTTYTFTARAADAAGNLSPPSNAATQPSIDTSPPTAPSGLRITRESGCDVTLAWTASTDNVEPASAIEYEIVVNGVIQRIVVDVTSTFAYHSNVTSVNTFTVRAVDRSGNSSPLSNEGLLLVGWAVGDAGVQLPHEACLTCLWG